MPRASQADLRPIVELIDAEYPRVARELLNPVLELLRLTRLRTGDVESLLILLVIAVRVAEDPRFRESTVEEQARLDQLPSRGTNVRSIAASLEMPRETVRRKVAELAEAGWVVRDEGGLTLTGQVFADLAKPIQSLEEMAARNYLTVRELLASADADAVSRPAEDRTLPAP